jgi:hypothetical protein
MVVEAEGSEAEAVSRNRFPVGEMDLKLVFLFSTLCLVGLRDFPCS